MSSSMSDWQNYPDQIPEEDVPMMVEITDNSGFVWKFCLVFHNGKWSWYGKELIEAASLKITAARFKPWL